VGFRLDSETESKLKNIADREGKSVSDILRNLVDFYTSRKPEINETGLPQYLEIILSEFKNRVKEYVERVKQFCEEHAKEITSIHESEKDKYEYWRDTCLHRYRTITTHNLHVYITDKLLPRITQQLDKAQIVMLEKHINRIIEDAVNEIYSSQYPPVYPI
jgi:signal recognition particle GTPase